MEIGKTSRLEMSLEILVQSLTSIRRWRAAQEYVVVHERPFRIDHFPLRIAVTRAFIPAALGR